MKKIILVTLCLMSINTFAAKDMFGNKIQSSSIDTRQADVWCGQMCDMNGTNCHDTCSTN
jgi:hypothetical protein